MRTGSAFGAMKIIRCLKSIEKFNDIGGLLDKPHDRELSVRLLQEELDEYVEAAHYENETEIRDALADIFYLWWGTVCKDKLQNKMWDIITEVCVSNDSKFDNNIGDAHKTQDMYVNEKNTLTIIEYNEKYKLYINKRIDGKILKSHKFKEPQLKTI